MPIIWNKIGKTKAVFFALLFLVNILFPMGAQPQQGLSIIFMSFILGILGIPLLIKINGSKERQLIQPIWNDNPLTIKRPLAFIHFGAFFFLIVGLSVIIGSAIRFHHLNYFGLTSIFLGLGILIGIWLTLKWTKAK